MGNHRRVLLAAFLSGCAGLVYELLWIRRLGEVFGHSTLATGAVTAAFMLGLAAGGAAANFLLGRARGRALELYAAAELALALFGAVSGAWLSWAEVMAFDHLGALAGPQGAGLAWLPVFLVALGPPAFLMGLTLPVLASLAPGFPRPESALAQLYGVNTLGAAAGCALAGLWLPPVIGVTALLRLAAVLNLAAAALAWRSRAEGAAPAPAPAAARAPASVLALSFATGAAALLCELAWLRSLCLLEGSSIHTTAGVLLFVLLGLGAGAILARALNRKPGWEAWAWVQLGVAAAVWAGLASFGPLFYLEVRAWPWLTSGFAARLAIHLLFTASLTALPCVLMGWSLPWLWSAAGAPSAGPFLAANTAGAVLGSLGAAFVILPAWGPERALEAGVVLSTLAACAAAFKGRKRGAPLACAAALAAALILRPSWDRNLLSSGVYLQGKAFKSVGSYGELVRRVNRSARLLYYADGLSSTVTVKDYPDGRRALQVNGKTDASSLLDMLTQSLLGYVPLALRPGAKTALVVGLGSGVTAGALARSPRLEALDVVEIEPRVADAAAFFAEENGGVLSDPRVTVIAADARHFLRAPGRNYDLIVSEPSNPWISGIAGLYTVEHLRQAARRLAPRGVLCQWFHSYHMSERDFRMVLETFAAVFPRVMLFRGGDTSDYLLLGTLDEWGTVDEASFAAFLAGAPAAREDLARYHLESPAALLGGAFVLEGKDWRGYSRGAPLNTDERPLLEFSAPASLHRSEEMTIYGELAGRRTSEMPAVLELPLTARNTARAASGALAVDDLPRAALLLSESLRRDPDDLGARLDSARLMIKMGRVDEGRERLAALSRRKPGWAEPLFHLAGLATVTGDFDAAEAWYRKGLAVDPENAKGWLNLGGLELRKGDRAKAAEAFSRGKKAKTSDAWTRRKLAAAQGLIE
jgi:spermidine synthase